MTPKPHNYFGIRYMPSGHNRLILAKLIKISPKLHTVRWISGTYRADTAVKLSKISSKLPLILFGIRYKSVQIGTLYRGVTVHSGTTTFRLYRNVPPVPLSCTAVGRTEVSDDFFQFIHGGVRLDAVGSVADDADVARNITELRHKAVNGWAVFSITAKGHRDTKGWTNRRNWNVGRGNVEGDFLDFGASLSATPKKEGGIGSLLLSIKNTTSSGLFRVSGSPGDHSLSVLCPLSRSCFRIIGKEGISLPAIVSRPLNCARFAVGLEGVSLRLMGKFRSRLGQPAHATCLCVHCKSITKTCRKNVTFCNTERQRGKP